MLGGSGRCKAKKGRNFAYAQGAQAQCHKDARTIFIAKSAYRGYEVEHVFSRVCSMALFSVVCGFCGRAAASPTLLLVDSQFLLFRSLTKYRNVKEIVKCISSCDEMSI